MLTLSCQRDSGTELLMEVSQAGETLEKRESGVNYPDAEQFYIFNTHTHFFLNFMHFGSSDRQVCRQRIPVRTLMWHCINTLYSRLNIRHLKVN